MVVAEAVVILTEEAETVAQVVVEITQAVMVTQQEMEQVIEAVRIHNTKAVAAVVPASQVQTIMVLTKVDTAVEV